MDLPFGLFLVGTADVDRHTIDRSVVRTPDGAVDKGVVFRLRLGATVQGSCGCQEEQKAGSSEREYRDET